MTDAEIETVAFEMRLRPGAEATYRLRHDQIWPELVEALKAAGVFDYQIFLDAETGRLFAVMTRRRDHGLAQLSQSPVMRRWWAMMADIMETEPDFEPRSTSLARVFTLREHVSPA